MKKTVLVLDDDKVARRMVSAVFEERGYKVIAFSSVAEAISAVRREHVDITLVDIKMPMVDGYKFCKFLRKKDEYSNIPIVVVTGEEERYGRGEAHALKVEAFIRKPFNPMELVAKVDEILGGT